MAVQSMTTLPSFLNAEPLAAMGAMPKGAEQASPMLEFGKLFQQVSDQSRAVDDTQASTDGSALSPSEQDALAQFMGALEGFLSAFQSRTDTQSVQKDAAEPAPSLPDAANTLADASQTLFEAFPALQPDKPSESGSIDSLADALQRLFQSASQSGRSVEKGKQGQEALPDQLTSQPNGTTDEATDGHDAPMVDVLASLAQILQHMQTRIAGHVPGHQSSEKGEGGQTLARNGQLLQGAAVRAAKIAAENAPSDRAEQAQSALKDELDHDHSAVNQGDALLDVSARLEDAMDLKKRMATLQVRLREAVAQMAEKASVSKSSDSPLTALTGLLMQGSDEAGTMPTLPDAASSLAHTVRTLFNQRLEHPAAVRDAVMQRLDKLAEQASASGETDSGSLSNGNGQSSNAALLQRTDSGQATAIAQSAITLPLRHPDWGKALAQRVMVLAQTNQQLAQVRLHPAHLGPIQIKLKLEKDQSMQVSLHAHHALTREAIEQALPRLRELFDQQGINLTAVNVSPDEQSHAQAFADARREGQAEGHHGGNTAVEAEEGAGEETPQPRWVRLNALVDHFV